MPPLIDHRFSRAQLQPSLRLHLDPEPLPQLRATECPWPKAPATIRSHCSSSMPTTTRQSNELCVSTAALLSVAACLLLRFMHFEPSTLTVSNRGSFFVTTPPQSMPRRFLPLRMLSLMPTQADQRLSPMSRTLLGRSWERVLS